jgi:hypothetical protein
MFKLLVRLEPRRQAVARSPLFDRLRKSGLPGP